MGIISGHVKDSEEGGGGLLTAQLSHEVKGGQREIGGKNQKGKKNLIIVLSATVKI